MTELLRLHAPGRRDTVMVVPPAVLALIVGITNAVYQALCLEQGVELYVCEVMISRGIVTGDYRIHSMLVLGPSETIRLVQPHDADLRIAARAARILIAEYGAHHIDLNFDCPAPKITRKDGGGALPYKHDRSRIIIHAMAWTAGEFGAPAAVKTRIDIDEAHETFLDTSSIVKEGGITATALHARTV